MTNEPQTTDAPVDKAAATPEAEAPKVEAGTEQQSEGTEAKTTEGDKPKEGEAEKPKEVKPRRRKVLQRNTRTSLRRKAWSWTRKFSASSRPPLRK